MTLFRYRPALNRVFAGDQLCYLAELNGSESSWDGLRQYDYNITRHYDKGDELLYRPLFFIWLAVNHWLFGSNYVWWNVATLGLHVVVVLLLFVLLRTIQPSPMADAFALLFAVMPSQVDLVIWNHMGGYIAGFAFLLLAMIAVHHVIEDEEPSRIPWLTVFVVSMTAAVLFYEMLVVVSALMALYLFCLQSWRGRPRRWRVVLASLVPGLIFTSLYVVHALHAPRLFYLDHTESQTLAQAFGVALSQVRAWLRQIYCPWVYSYIAPLFSRHCLTQIDVVQLTSLPGGLVTSACLLVLVGVWKCFTLRRVARQVPLVLMVIAMRGAYALLIALGRQAILANSAYYAYFFSILLVLAFYLLPDWNPDQLRWIPTVGGLALLVVFQAYFTYHATATVGRANQEADRCLASVRHFVAEHRQEPGFSFAVQNPEEENDHGPAAASPDLNPTFRFTHGYPDTGSEEVHWPLSVILFPRYYDSSNPRYLLQWKDGYWLQEKRTEKQCIHRRSAGPPLAG